MSDFQLSLKFLGDASSLQAAAGSAAGAVGLVDAAAKEATAAVTETGRAVDVLDQKIKPATVVNDAYGASFYKAAGQAGYLVTATEQVVVGLDAYGQAIRRSKADVDAVAAAQAKAAQAAAAQAAEIRACRDQLDPTAAAASKAAAELEKFNSWLSAGAISADEHRRLTGLVTDSLGQIGKAATVSAGQMQMAKRIVLMNLTDMGQVMAATGGDMRMLAAIAPDMFYGFKLMGGGAALAAYSVAAIGIAIGGAVAVYESHQASLRAVTEAHRLYGDQLGLTRSQLESLASATNDTAGVTVREARAMEAALLKSGQVGAQAFKLILDTARDYAQATGTDATAAAAALGKSLASPAKAARDLNDQFHFLTTTQREHIELMDRMGEKDKAQAELAQALKGHLRGLADDGVGYLGRAWNSVSNAVSTAWDWMGRVGQPDTVQQQLNTAQKLLEAAQTGQGGLLGRSPKQIQQLMANRDRLQNQVDAEAARAAAAKFSSTRTSAVDAGLDIAQSFDSDSQARLDLTGKKVKLEAAISALTDGGKLRSSDQINQYQRLSSALEIVNQQIETFSTASEKATAINRAQAAAVGMDADARAVWLAKEQTRISLIGSALPLSEQQAQIDAAGQAALVQLSLTRENDIRSLIQQADAAESLALALGGGVTATEAAERAIYLAAESAKGGTARLDELAAAYDRLHATQKDSTATKLLSNLTDQYQAAVRLADAEQQGAEAVADAAAENEKARLIAQGYAENVAEAAAQVVRLTEAEKVRGSLAKMDRQKSRDLVMLDTELRLVGETEAIRERELAMLELKFQLEDAGVVDVQTELEARRSIAEAIADKNLELKRAQAAQQEYARIWTKAAENIQDSLGNAFRSVLDTGKLNFRSFFGSVVNLTKDVAAQIAAALVFKPMMGGILSTMGMGQTAQTLGYGGGGGFGGSLALLGMLASGSGAAFGGGNNSMAGLGTMIGVGTLASSIFSQGLMNSLQYGVALDGVYGSVAGGVADFAANTLGMGATAGQAVLDGFSYSPWGIVGSLGANALGLVKNPGIGSAIGGTLGGFAGGALGGGLAAGALAGTQLGSFAGPIGAIAGAMLGSIVGGLFGGKKKQAQPYSYTGVGVDAESIGLWSGMAGDGGSLAQTRGAGIATVDTLRDIFNAFGVVPTARQTTTVGYGDAGTLQPEAMAVALLKKTAKAGQIRAGMYGKSTDMAWKVNGVSGGYGAENIGAPIQSAGLDPYVISAMAQSDSKDLKGLQEDVDAAKKVRETVQALRVFTDALVLVDEASAKSAQDMRDQLRQVAAAAGQYGDRANVEAMIKTRLEAAARGDDMVDTTATALSQSIQKVKSDFKYLSDAMKEFGADTSLIAIGLQKALDKLKTDFDSGISSQLAQYTGDASAGWAALLESQKSTLMDAIRVGGDVGQVQALNYYQQREYLMKLTAVQRQQLGLGDSVISQSVAALTGAQSLLVDQANAISSLASAAADAASAFADLVSSLKDSQTSLALGDLSVLSPEDKLAQARTQFDVTTALAQTGDRDALSVLGQQAEALLTASRAVNASGAAYVADYTRVQQVLAQAVALSETQASDQAAAAAKMDVLGRLLSGINGNLGATGPAAETLNQLLSAYQVANGLAESSSFSADLIANLQAQGVAVNQDILTLINGGSLTAPTVAAITAANDNLIQALRALPTDITAAMAATPIIDLSPLYALVAEENARRAAAQVAADAAEYNQDRKVPNLAAEYQNLKYQQQLLTGGSSGLTKEVNARLAESQKAYNSKEIDLTTYRQQRSDTYAYGAQNATSAAQWYTYSQQSTAESYNQQTTALANWRTQALADAAEARKQALAIGDTAGAAAGYQSALADINGNFSAQQKDITSWYQTTMADLASQYKSVYLVSQQAELTAIQKRLAEVTAVAQTMGLTLKYDVALGFQDVLVKDNEGNLIESLASQDAIQALFAQIDSALGNRLATGTLPAFEKGGDHTGGWMLAGEKGKELINVGPARIFNASQTKEILAGASSSSPADTTALVAELKALRATVEALLRVSTAGGDGTMARLEAAVDSLQAIEKSMALEAAA